MKATIEISMYPLTGPYEKFVLAFIDDLRINRNIEIETNGLSTQIFGDLEYTFPLLQKLMQKYFESCPSIFVMKVGMGHLRFGQNKERTI
jgi:uncharacterized protein YqgV (UPF0045/DUF77 family)